MLGVDPDEWVDLLDLTFDERARGGVGNGAISGIRALCARIGAAPSYAQLHAALELRLAALQDDAPLRAETVPVLRALRAAGVKVAIVSDCWFELPGFLPTSALAGLFDAAVYSSEVGAAKPDPAMYRTACDLLGADPAGCLYVGDGGGRELTGAQAFGLTAVQLAAPDLGDHLTFHAEPDWRGGRIETLHDVLALVGAPMLVA
ncbi:HAD family hydrolase [Dactylosporangium sucinum]|uniref:Hydrolase n=1 Tax=Dactylosporangium sucinum TaxID=1424081 RepID=A0A917U5R1_9ACTN|nr:HAD-IA family hydrolase [Dactylosporangium sucinum]GGM56775.1 hypothetical protein GCM10007977_068140 [Dactylosporangium sucinum]